MMLVNRRNLQLALVVSLIASLFYSSLVVPSVRAQEKLAAPTSHVADNANLLDATARQQLENILTNLQLRSGINLTVVMVKSTGGRDIYDFSYDLAKEWGIGLRTNSNKSLLLVASIDDKISFTHISKGVAKQIPEGALADLGQRLRSTLESGQVSDGLLRSIQWFIGELAGKVGFSTEGLDQEPTRAAAVETSMPAAKETSRAELMPAASPVGSESPAPITTKPPKVTKPPAVAVKRTTTGVDDQAEAEQVAIIQTRPFADRVKELRNFIDTHPDSKSKGWATELLISSRAALGDDNLRTGNKVGGLEQFMLAISESTPDISDKLFSGVVSQIPYNLYLRGERAEAFKAAQMIESKFAANAKRLLAVSGFYLSIERGDEAARIAQQAVTLAPDMAAAYDALGLALHISLRLDEAAAAYKKALELDPKTPIARRSLADLNRAAGKTSDALASYREQLAADPGDKNARVGLILSLYELDQTAEADKELEAALKDNPRNVTLLAGTAYWFIAHKNYRRGLELARMSADVEPRYTWGQIALARALIADKGPEVAEACIRFARQHGRFPTLEYELANALAAMGLYEEAGETLAHSFTLKDGLLQTQLAGRIPAQASGFIELLAPERRASIFQNTAADNDSNAGMLKALLGLTQALSPSDNGKVDEANAVTAAREFASGNDEMRVYRQLYASSRLLQRGIGLQAAQELADAARDGVDAAAGVPCATIAVQADELRDIRAQAIAAGGTPDMPEAPRNVLTSLLRGRIEDLSGWALFNQDKPADAVGRLRLAVGVIPEATPLWRVAAWHLGAALQQSGSNEEALNYYIKSYNAGANDSLRRNTIEMLYRKVNGSLDGLDDRIGAARTAAAVGVPANGAGASNAADQLNSSGAAVPAPGPTPTPEPSSVQPAATPEPSPAPVVEPTATPTPESSPSPEPSATPTPDSAPASTPAPTPSPEAPVTTRSRELPAPTPSPSATPATETRPRRVKPPDQ